MSNSNLVPKQITDKNGKVTTVWVRPDQGTSSEQIQSMSAAPKLSGGHTPNPDEIIDPESAEKFRDHPHFGANVPDSEVVANLTSGMNSEYKSRGGRGQPWRSDSDTSWTGMRPDDLVQRNVDSSDTYTVIRINMGEDPENGDRLYVISAEDGAGYESSEDALYEITSLNKDGTDPYPNVQYNDEYDGFVTKDPEQAMGMAAQMRRNAQDANSWSNYG